VNRIFKRTCHITIRLDQLEARPAEGKGGAPKAQRARKGGTAGAAAAKPKTRKKKEVAA
jgi:hypothetical protein